MCVEMNILSAYVIEMPFKRHQIFKFQHTSLGRVRLQHAHLDKLFPLFT